LGEIRRGDAREHGHGEDLEVLALRLRRSLGDRAVAVHGQERRAAARELAYGRRDGSGNVVELQVCEDFLVAGQQPVEQLEVMPRRRELEPDLVERDAAAEPLDELSRACKI